MSYTKEQLGALLLIEAALLPDVAKLAKQCLELMREVDIQKGCKDHHSDGLYEASELLHGAKFNDHEKVLILMDITYLTLSLDDENYQDRQAEIKLRWGHIGYEPQQ